MFSYKIFADMRVKIAQDSFDAANFTLAELRLIFSSLNILSSKYSNPKFKDEAIEFFAAHFDEYKSYSRIEAKTDFNGKEFFTIPSEEGYSVAIRTSNTEAELREKIRLDVLSKRTYNVAGEYIAGDRLERVVNSYFEIAKIIRFTPAKFDLYLSALDQMDYLASWFSNPRDSAGHSLSGLAQEVTLLCSSKAALGKLISDIEFTRLHNILEEIIPEKWGGITESVFKMPQDILEFWDELIVEFGQPANTMYEHSQAISFHFDANMYMSIVSFHC